LFIKRLIAALSINFILQSSISLRSLSAEKSYRLTSCYFSSSDSEASFSSLFRS
jgi:hypothetical protein